jgi:hypothetical protein
MGELPHVTVQLPVYKVSCCADGTVLPIGRI